MSNQQLPEHVGPYRILSILGEGGMGVVYAAEQSEPVRRRVALKVIGRAADRKDILGRFALEQQALAMMNHPNIAKVLDAGSDSSGRPYFAMELVKGESITRYCDRNRLSLAQRLELFIQVCHGVQHAHHKGVIHRDLKPNNILVEIFDEKPLARIIDFGLARATNHLALQEGMFTEIGQIIGTPEYMSPEQAEMTGTDIDTRSDVYSLGVVLYELLTGSMPFTSKEMRQAGMHDIQRRIREVEPPIPSKRVSTVAGEAADLAGLRRLTTVAFLRYLRDDLDWIVMRCLEKDRTRRYQTAAELAADIERHLGGEAILAGPPSVTYRLGKLARRHRLALGVLATVFLTMSVALVLVIRASNKAVEARREAEARRAAEVQASARLREVLGMVQAQYRVAHAEELARASSEFMPLAPNRIHEAQTWLEEARAFVAETRSGNERELATTERDRRRREAEAALPGLVAVLEKQVAPDCDIEQRMATIRASVAGSQDLWRQAKDRFQQVSDLPLRPQDWLVPLGQDPASRLEEFAVLQTGAIPERDAQGRLQLRDDSALVLVLLPGSTCTLGAVAGDMDVAVTEQRPVVITLDPFFIGKHEVTQGQWARMTGLRPSRYSAAGKGPPPGNELTDCNPVEQVSWVQAMHGLRRFGLSLPTEAQWECAARGKTTTRWWTGVDRQDLAMPSPAENLADATCARYDQGRFREATGAWPTYDDGWFFHAPVGTFRPNAFGLYDMLGNVKEHCRDAWAESTEERVHAKGDGLREGPERQLHAVRGSSWKDSYLDARASQRRSLSQESPYDNVGVRVARRFDR